MPKLTEFTACFWMNSSDRKGTPLSYAVPQEKNELVIDYNNYFMLSIGGEGRYACTNLAICSKEIIKLIVFPVYQP